MLLIILLATICMADEVKKEIEVLKVDKHEINIEGRHVTEIISIRNIAKYNFNNSFHIWICSKEAKIYTNESAYYFNNIKNGNISLNISIPPEKNVTLRIEYDIGNKFEKKIFYSTENMEIRIKTDRKIRGNIELEYRNGAYYYSFEPKKGDYIVIEFEEKSNHVLTIAGIIAIALGIAFVFAALRRK